MKINFLNKVNLDKWKSKDPIRVFAFFIVFVSLFINRFYYSLFILVSFLFFCIMKDQLKKVYLIINFIIIYFSIKILFIFLNTNISLNLDLLLNETYNILNIIKFIILSIILLTFFKNSKYIKKIKILYIPMTIFDKIINSDKTDLKNIKKFNLAEFMSNIIISSYEEYKSFSKD